MEIKEISFLTYFLKCKGFSTPISDYYVQNAMHAGNKRLLAAYTEEEQDIVGIVILTQRDFKHNSLDYMVVREESRGQGIAKQLLAAAVQYAKEQGAEFIAARAMTKDKKDANLREKEEKSYTIIDKLLLLYGFKVAATSTIIRCAKDEKGTALWYRFMKERGEKLLTRSNRQGFSVVSFAKAGTLIDVLNEKVEREFPRELKPSYFIDNPVDRLVPELSFMAVKDNIPVAFCTATTVEGKTIVFQQLSVARKYQNTGVFFLPFEAFMKQLLSEESYSKVSYTVFDNNKEMKLLVDRFLSPFIESRKIQKLYRYTVNEYIG